MLVMSVKLGCSDEDAHCRRHAPRAGSLLQAQGETGLLRRALTTRTSHAAQEFAGQNGGEISSKRESGRIVSRACHLA